MVKDVVLRVGDLELDLVSRAVSRPGWKIGLLPREFQLLEYLVCNQGQIVPAGDAASACLGSSFRSHEKKRAPIARNRTACQFLM